MADQPPITVPYRVFLSKADLETLGLISVCWAALENSVEVLFLALAPNKTDSKRHQIFTTREMTAKAGKLRAQAGKLKTKLTQKNVSVYAFLSRR